MGIIWKRTLVTYAKQEIAIEMSFCWHRKKKIRINPLKQIILSEHCLNLIYFHCLQHNFAATTSSKRFHNGGDLKLNFNLIPSFSTCPPKIPTRRRRQLKWSLRQHVQAIITCKMKKKILHFCSNTYTFTEFCRWRMMNDYRNTKHEMRQWKMNSIGNATDKVDGEGKLSVIS